MDFLAHELFELALGDEPHDPASREKRDGHQQHEEQRTDDVFHMSTPRQQIKRQILGGLQARINAWEQEREKIVIALARRDNKAARKQQLDSLIAEAKAQMARVEAE